MRRHILGIIALVLLGGAVILSIWPPQSNAAETWQAIRAAFIRTGVLASVIWLAYRELERLPRWLFTVIPIAGLLVAARPRWAIVLVPLVLAIMFLTPKKKDDPRR
ncbi:MAG: hypothetical protein ACOX1P_10010 [Thermoguttaceae bacterium]|jgi:uncharacterized membrane protein HdeD (DUF308 family)